jgi:hypothetical protein
MEDQDIFDTEERCELCGESFMVSTVFVEENADEDSCTKHSAEICVRCLFLYDNNIKLMVSVLDKRIQRARIEEEMDELNDQELEF